MHAAVEDMAKSETFHGYGPEQGYDFLRAAIVKRDFHALGVDIADDEIFALYLHDFAVAQHLRGRRTHLLERLDCLFRLAFLVDAEHGVDNDDKQDDEYIGGRFALVDRGHSADGGGGKQDQNHRVCHLHEEPLDERILFGCLQFVFAVRFKALLRLGGR